MRVIGAPSLHLSILTFFMRITVKRPKHVRVMTGAVEGDTFVGLRGMLKLRYPMKNGVIRHWRDMERVWSHVYHELKVQSDDHPVLFTETAINPRKNREKAAEVFFETFNVPALYISVQAVLSLYASGRTTGLVVDCGDGSTSATPVFEGFAVQNAIIRSDVGGRDVTDRLRLLLRKAGYVFHTSAEFEVVRDVKERACYVALEPEKEDTGVLESEDRQLNLQYKLPDGNVIDLRSERFEAPEILFRPDLAGFEYPGVHNALDLSIRRSDLDLRRTLYSNVVLSGGSTLFAGFGNRLLYETKQLAPSDMKIRISAPPERRFSTWMGGSILASLGTFKKLWILKQEYEDEGVSALDRFF